MALTAGRQRIALDDERFVGSVGFRQNAQAFDAVRLEWTGVPKLRLDVSYAWNVRTIWAWTARAHGRAALAEAMCSAA